MADDANHDVLKRRAEYLRLRASQSEARATRLRGQLRLTLADLARFGAGRQSIGAGNSVVPFPLRRRRR